MMCSNQSREQLSYSQTFGNGSHMPENPVFNVKLQEFAQQVSILATLYTGGKLSSSEVFEQVKQLSHQLKQSQY